LPEELLTPSSVIKSNVTRKKFPEGREASVLPVRDLKKGQAFGEGEPREFRDTVRKRQNDLCPKPLWVGGNRLVGDWGGGGGERGGRGGGVDTSKKGR